MRSYGQFCAVARSLDVIGDRWTILIVRELVERGPSRYTDIRSGLPGVATNLLADRLRELEAAGVVAREEAPPPIAATLFRLTERGEELRPLLDELTRWGMPLMAEDRPGDAVRGHWLAGGLALMLTDAHPGEPPVTVALELGDGERVVLQAAGGEVRSLAAPETAPDLTVTGPARTLGGLMLGMLDLDGAAAMGATADGDASVLARFAPA